MLAELGVAADKVPVIEVCNKIDLLDRGADGTAPALAAAAPAGRVAATVPVSAQTGEGLDRLLAAIEPTLGAASRIFRVRIEHAAGADIGWLYGHAEIVGKETADEEGQIFEVRVDPRHKAAFTRRFRGRIAGPA